MLEILQMKGLYGGIGHKDRHENIWNFLDIYGPFSFKNISQESFRLWLFPFSLMGEATKWLADLPRTLSPLGMNSHRLSLLDSFPHKNDDIKGKYPRFQTLGG